MEKDQTSSSYSNDKANDVEIAVVAVNDAAKDADDMRRSESDTTATVRGLKGRHMQLIGIGASIGTGLYIGSARALIYAGPLGATLAYAIYSVAIWGVCLGTCEMAAFLPVRGGLVAWSRLWLDDAASTALGWNYFYTATMFACADLVAIGGLMDFWLPNVSLAVWVTVALVIITALNTYHVRFYGASEFYLASLKVILMVGLILMTFIIMLGGNPQKDRIGFRYWKKPGLFAEYFTTGPLGRFLGFFQVFKLAAFAIGGPDVISMCAAEAVQPRKTIPRATKTIVFRMAVFFVLGAVCIGVLVPYNDPQLLEAVETGVGSNASAYVVGMKRVGITVLPHIFNALVMTSALSCSNGFAYVATRLLHSLASEGKAPKIFAQTTRHGIPLYAYGVVFAIMLLSFLQVSSNSAVVFGWFINLSSVGIMINFSAMAILSLRFRAGLKKQGFVASEFLPWSSKWTIPYQYFSLTVLWIVILFQGWTVFVKGGWDVQEFLTCYFGLVIAAAIYIFWKIKTRCKVIKLEDIDFTSRVAEFDALDQYYIDNPPTSTNMWGRFLDKVF